MHYKNGREAKEGDPVVHRDSYENAPAQAGTIHSLVAGSDTCNGRLAIAVMGGFESPYVTVGNCLHAEDALAEAEVEVPAGE